jgi:hypothetical protein
VATESRFVLILLLESTGSKAAEIRFVSLALDDLDRLLARLVELATIVLDLHVVMFSTKAGSCLVLESLSILAKLTDLVFLQLVRLTEQLPMVLLDQHLAVVQNPQKTELVAFVIRLAAFGIASTALHLPGHSS